MSRSPLLLVLTESFATLLSAVAGWAGLPFVVVFVAMALTIWHARSRRTRHNKVRYGQATG